MSGSHTLASGLGGTVLALGLVVALIIGLGWLLRRSGGMGPHRRAGLRVVATLPLGVKERLLVVSVGKQQMLLGVTAHQVTALGTLDAPLEEAGEPESFAAQLRQRIGSGGQQ